MPVTGKPTFAGSEAETLDLYRAHLSRGRATLAELFGSHMEVASNGAWLHTSDGQRFLNCGGYGVLLMGARHPIVMDAVHAQLARHPVSTRILLEPTVGRAAQALASVTPNGLDRVHFTTSGTEAVETGLKLARAHGKRRIVSMNGGYHGKTLGALSATAREVYQRPFRPLLPDVSHVRYGDADALRAKLQDDGEDACVIVEPVQGEGGVVLPPHGYLRAVADLCRSHGAFLVVDEVQSGLGRLGTWWGVDAEAVVPDVLVTGKALGGGVLPVSAAVAARSTFAPFDKDPYLHTSTFSGAPVLMAAVCGALAAIEADDLVAAAARLGDRLLPELAGIVHQNCHDLVVDVRGRGLLIGIEFVEPGLAGEMLIELFNHGLVANHSMNSNATVRLTPPATLTDFEIDHLLRSFDRATKDLVARATRMPDGG